MRKCLKVILCGALNSKLDSFVNKQGNSQNQNTATCFRQNGASSRLELQCNKLVLLLLLSTEVKRNKKIDDFLVLFLLSAEAKGDNSLLSFICIKRFVNYSKD
jgi:hypothetical protein